MDELKVNFLLQEDGSVLAVFPSERAGNFVLSYAHVGQHGDASVDYCRKLKAATEKQFAPLLKELKQIGYALKIMQPSRYFTFR